MRQFLFSLLLLVLAPFLYAQTNPNLNLVWESDGYVPAEYQGKPLPSIGSSVRVVALTSTPAKDLEFWWRLDDYELPDYSGFGKNIITFKVTKPADGVHVVRLIVKKAGQNILNQTLEIPVVSPQIIFYEQDPILGEVFSRSFAESYQLAKPEITFVAEPLFFPRGEVGKLKYTWKLNDTQVAADNQSGRVITFTIPSGGGQGTNEVKLLVENPASALQFAQNAFSIIFDSSYTNDLTF